MATEIKMPQLGLTMEEGTVERWLKAEGDPVKAGEPLLEITTDKLTNEVAAETDGVLQKIVAQEGADVPVKGLLGYIGRPGERVGAPTAAAAPAAPAVEAAAAPNGPGTVLVIGGGPGGYVAAIRAAQLGARVTLVEREHLGGTCLNIGCIPTKCLLHSAELVSQIKDQGAEIGVEADGVRVNFPQVIAHKNAVSKQLTSGVAGLLKANKVVKIDGEASFTGPKTLSVKKSDGSVEEMTADAIIVATGSVNAQPPIPGLKENPNCIDSTGALSLEQLPKSMVVIGGGVIGLELACACGLRHQDHRGGGAGPHAAYAGRRPDQDRRGPHEERWAWRSTWSARCRPWRPLPWAPRSLAGTRLARLSALRRRRSWWPSAGRPTPPA